MSITHLHIGFYHLLEPVCVPPCQSHIFTSASITCWSQSVSHHINHTSSHRLLSPVGASLCPAISITHLHIGFYHLLEPVCVQPYQSHIFTSASITCWSQSVSSHINHTSSHRLLSPVGASLCPAISITYLHIGFYHLLEPVCVQPYQSHIFTSASITCWSQSVSNHINHTSSHRFLGLWCQYFTKATPHVFLFHRVIFHQVHVPLCLYPL